MIVVLTYDALSAADYALEEQYGWGDGRDVFTEQVLDDVWSVHATEYGQWLERQYIAQDAYILEYTPRPVRRE